MHKIVEVVLSDSKKLNYNWSPIIGKEEGQLEVWWLFKISTICSGVHDLVLCVSKAWRVCRLAGCLLRQPVLPRQIVWKRTWPSLWSSNSLTIVETCRLHWLYPTSDILIIQSTKSFSSRGWTRMWHLFHLKASVVMHCTGVFFFYYPDWQLPFSHLL